MVVDDPADPLAGAGPDVLVVLGARLPPADAANCRALVERLDSMGTAALAYRLVRLDAAPHHLRLLACSRVMAGDYAGAYEACRQALAGDKP